MAMAMDMEANQGTRAVVVALGRLSMHHGRVTWPYGHYTPHQTDQNARLPVTCQDDLAADQPIWPLIAPLDLGSLARSGRPISGHIGSLGLYSAQPYAHKTPMGHTQTTHSNNNRPYVLVRARTYFFLLSRHGHVPVYARLRHIKRTMQEPELPSD